MIEIARRKRGEIDDSFIRDYKNLLERQLISLLGSTDPQKRTVAAVLIGKKQYFEAVELLCQVLVKEKALYSKIAISETLGDMGLNALPELINYIGVIGKNRHKKLPKEIFKKWSYPLPRDIVIRTIVKMDQRALPLLRDRLKVSEPEVVSELLDAIGHISFYTKNTDSLGDVMTSYYKHKHNKIVVWKFLRSLQSFPNQEAKDMLEMFFLESEIPELRWEAARSLGQLREKKILERGVADPNELVRKMVKMSILHISKI